MDYKTYFKCIDDLCNESNRTYNQARADINEKLRRENKVYGIAPIYIDGKYYLPGGGKNYRRK